MALRARLGEADAGVLTKVGVADDKAAAFTGDNGFGGLEWGASTSQLKARQPKAKPNSDGKTWLVEQQVAGKNAFVGYVFIEDKFVVAIVLFNETYVNKNNYLDDHEELRGLLTKKYGAPKTASKDYWSNDLYRNDPGDWGMGVATGRLTRISVWDTPATEIELVTKGENFKITNRIRYGSKKFDKLVSEHAQRSKTDGL